LKTGPEIGWLKAIKNQTQIYPEIEWFWYSDVRFSTGHCILSKETF
jgi:hypothetical protein